MTMKRVDNSAPSRATPGEEAAAPPATAAPLPSPQSVLWGGMSPLSQLLWKNQPGGIEVTTTKQQAGEGLGLGPAAAAVARFRLTGSPLSRMQKLNGVNMSATLTWKDLGVKVTNARGETHTLLQGLTGYAEPGNIMAIMGPSGSGKSTLLDALAGRLAKNAAQTGDILLNGCRTQRSYGTAAYVTQEDCLIGTLTVRETIYYTAQLRLPDRMSKEDKAAIVESTMVDMGLQECADTYIGNWHLRGLSGGEKRRVSIALEILTRPRLLFLDEPTSGLDSASAFFVTSTLLNLARDGRTVIASIHQPSSEVFQLFDNLTLLSGGKLVYFGEAPAACEHFASAGFPCPPLRNPSDHFLRAINSDFDRVKATLRGSFKIKADVEVQTCDPLDKISASQAIKVLIDAYQTSDAAMLAVSRVHDLSHMEGTVLESAGSQASSFMQAYTLTCRSSINMSRDMGYYWLRLVIYILLTLCIGTIYYKLGKDYNSIMARAACMSYIAGFLTFMAIGGFPSFVEDMKVFHRERLNGHYGVVAFVIGNTLSSLPYLLLISLASGSICYYMVQLHPGFSHFAYFVLALFACVTVVESLMMAVASVVPNFLMGIITGAGIQGIFMLLAGFFRLPNDLPKPFWRYPMSYLSFHMYALQGMYQNEFLGVTFNSLFPGFHITGDKVIVQNYQINIQRNKWWDLGVLVSMVIIYRVIFFICIKMSEDVQPLIRLHIARYSSKYLARKKSALQNTIRPEDTSPPPPIQNSDVLPQQATLQ